MVDKTINSNVDVSLSSQGMEAAVRNVRTQVEKVGDSITKAGANLNMQLKQVKGTLAQIQTLQRSSTAGVFGNDQTFGRQVRAMEEYRRGMMRSADAAGVLRSRVADINTQMANLARTGGRPDRNQLLNARNLENAAAAYGKVQTQIGNLRGRIALLGEDQRKAFEPMLRNLDRLDAKNKKLFANEGRTRFGPQQAQIQRATQALKEQVVAAEKLEKTEAVRLQTLRQQAAAIITNTNLERQAALAAQVRTAQTAIRNGNLIGQEPFRMRDTNYMNRLDRATRLAARAQAQLNAEMAKPNPQVARINILIQRYKQLQVEQGRAIALERQQGRSQTGGGGFFAGLRSVRGSLFDQHGEHGAAFGAGALVGRVGAYAAAATAIYGLINAMSQGIRFTVEYQDALAQLQAVSGSTGTEMDRLSDTILRVSQNSANSVLELTKSATIIAQAGFAGNEIGVLLENVVNLAAASGSTTDESVDILTSALGAFQLQAGEATRVTDALVAALNDSKLAVNQVQLGLQFVGATARLNNITFNELVASLGAMADAGIRSGSTMSTGLRQMLVDFIDPSKKLVERLEQVGLTTADIDVKVLGLTEVLTRLRDSGFQAYGALETRAAAAFAVLSSNIDQIEKLEQATLRQNVAQEAAATRVDSVSARWQRMLNTFGMLGDVIGKNVTPLMKLLTEVLKILGTTVLVLVAGVTSLLAPLGLLFDEGTRNTASLEDLAAAFESAGLSSEEAGAKALEYRTSLDDMQTALRDTEAEMSSLQQEQDSLRTETQKLIMRQEEFAGKNGDLTQTTAKVTNEVANLTSRFPELRQEFLKTEGGISGLINAMIKLDVKAQETLGNMARVALGQATIERQNALEELGRARGRAGGLGRGFGGAERRGFRSRRSNVIRNGSDEDRAALARAERLLEVNSVGSLRQFTDLFRTNEAVSSVFGQEVQSEILTGLQNFQTADSAMRRNQRQADASDFLTSADGRELIANQTSDSGRSTRAASQGDSGGTVMSGLRARQAQLAELEQRYQGNDAALAAIGAAQASNQADIARLTPVRDRVAGRSAGTATRRRNNRLDTQFERNKDRIAREALQARRQEFENALDDFNNSGNLDNLEGLLNSVTTELDEWLEAEQAQAVESITNITNGGDSAQRRAQFAEQERLMLETAGRNAQRMRIEEVNKIGDALSRVLTQYISQTVQGIEQQSQQATFFSRRNVALAQARVTGLQRGNLVSGGVPDYVRSIAQRDLELAQRRADQATIAATDREIDQKLELVQEAIAQQREIEARLATAGGDTEDGRTKLRQVQLTIQTLRQDTENLRIENDALRASYEALNNLPTTFQDGFAQAVEAARIELNAADNLGQEIINNLGQPLAAIREGFNGFFTDIITGSESVGGAFTNMANRIIDSMLAMAAQAVATQIFGLLLNFISPAAPSASGIGGVFGSVGSSIGNAIPRNYRGGEIEGGIKSRDSTLVHAAKGEFMMRSAAVDSVGTDFLHAINQNGAAALRGLGQPTINMPQFNGGETNVYVVAEKPASMGPNDVIATISNDVLQGGVTKKLIKKVAQGG